MTAGAAATARTILLVMIVAVVDMAPMIRRATTVAAQVADTGRTIRREMTVGVAVVAGEGEAGAGIVSWQSSPR